MDAIINNLLYKNVDQQSIVGLVTVSILIIWALIWKATALYKSARNDEKIWFIAILLLNTVGILEIAYLFFFAKEKLTLEAIKVNVKSYKIKNPLKFKK